MSIEFFFILWCSVNLCEIDIQEFFKEVGFEATDSKLFMCMCYLCAPWDVGEKGEVVRG